MIKIGDLVCLRDMYARYSLPYSRWPSRQLVDERSAPLSEMSCVLVVDFPNDEDAVILYEEHMFRVPFCHVVDGGYRSVKRIYWRKYKS